MSGFKAYEFSPFLRTSYKALGAFVCLISVTSGVHFQPEQMPAVAIMQRTLVGELVGVLLELVELLVVETEAILGVGTVLPL